MREHRRRRARGARRRRRTARPRAAGRGCSSRGCSSRSARPVCQRPSDAFRSAQAQRPQVPLGLALVELDVLELEHHVELLPRRVGEQPRLLDGDARHLADGQQPVAAGEHLAMHLGQELVDPRPGDVVLGRQEDPAGAVAVGQRRVLGDEVDDVHAEAVDPAVEPPAHHLVDRGAHLRVLPVQVGLLAREEVQVVLAGRLVELPRRAGEGRAPVRRLGAGRARLHAGARRPPPVPVALRAVAARAGLGEPRVLVGRVVDDEVHDELMPRACTRRAASSKSASVPNVGSTSR